MVEADGNERKVSRILNATVWAFALAVLVTTALPMTNSVTWWVRMWDFPRVHIAVAALFVFVASLRFAISLKLLLLGPMFVAFVYQAIQIFPYTPLARTEVDLVAAPSAADEVTMLSVNVLMDNTRYDDLTQIIEREDPDVLFLMETDQVWNDALKEVLARYTTVKSHLADDHYGLIFATRLESVSVELLWPEADDTPALKAILLAPNGTEFNFIGLHPRPPVPGNDTVARDAQIKKAALMTASTDRPTVCMGDFNDVVWSWTTRRFKRYGQFLEPRVGRGMMSSFHAKNPFLRFPIDHFFLTESVGLVSFNRLENFCSDHFPMSATVFFDREK